MEGPVNCSHRPGAGGADPASVPPTLAVLRKAIARTITGRWAGRRLYGTSREYADRRRLTAPAAEATLTGTRSPSATRVEATANGDFLAHGQFPVVRGLQLTRDELLRRSVIMALMCQGRRRFSRII